MRSIVVGLKHTYAYPPGELVIGKLYNGILKGIIKSEVPSEPIDYIYFYNIKSGFSFKREDIRGTIIGRARVKGIDIVEYKVREGRSWADAYYKGKRITREELNYLGPDGAVYGNKTKYVYLLKDIEMFAKPFELSELGIENFRGAFTFVKKELNSTELSIRNKVNKLRVENREKLSTFIELMGPPSRYSITCNINNKKKNEVTVLDSLNTRSEAYKLYSILEDLELISAHVNLTNKEILIKAEDNA